VRLITPKVLVVQTVDPVDLEFITRYDGAGVLALMPETAARFRHDPVGGPELADRMVVTQLPDTKPHNLGKSSAFQQRQELAQLEVLAAAPSVSKRSAAPAPAVESREIPSPPSERATDSPPVEVPAAAKSSDAVDKLSAWLLEHADLTGPTST
jgi:hypothetical protein